jgi:hypothetical protein
MKSKLGDKQLVVSGDASITVKVQKSQSRFKRIRHPGERDTGQGDFFLLLDITATNQAVYIPISIASGKKIVGFIYHIEGTGAGTIDTTDISCSGDGVTKITLGTLFYAKIPAGKTASFRLFVQIAGSTSKEYRVVINQINYKLDPSDARYKKLVTDIGSKSLKFL